MTNELDKTQQLKGETESNTEDWNACTVTIEEDEKDSWTVSISHKYLDWDDSFCVNWGSRKKINWSETNDIIWTDEGCFVLDDNDCETELTALNYWSWSRFSCAKYKNRGTR